MTIEQKTCEDCISREVLKEKKVYSEERHEYVIPVAQVDWLPSVTPQSKKGHWIVEVWSNREHHTCSVCQRVVNYEPCYHYCPYCGAEMECKDK